MVPESPQGTLVEIEEPVEDGRSTPQIVGEAERAFARMEGREVLQEEMNKEADNLVESGLALPSYVDAPEYVGPFVDNDDEVPPYAWIFE